MEFEFRGLPWNIVFGVGAITELADRIAELGYERPLILTTPGQRARGQRIIESLAPDRARLFAEARTHTPIETVMAAVEAAEAWRADCTVALGGGSTIGLGKGLALHSDLPNLAVPTTYSGSEMTNIWGYLEDGSKRIGRNDKVLPRLTIYDPQLTVDLPPDTTGASGLNAMAQAIVNVTVVDPNPLLVLWALEAIRQLAASLPGLIKEPTRLDLRIQALYGAFLAGAVIGSGKTGLHHKLCHVFGGMFNTAHAQTHALFLPHSVAFNRDSVPEATARVANALGVADAATGLRALADDLCVPRSLAELGVAEDDLDAAARAVTSVPVVNPRPVDFESIRQLLQDAFDGSVRS
jgi:maleylacetate reductase